MSDRDFKGLTVLITAGPTREAIDAVRFISNVSSGRMGEALAAAFVKRGARVILIERKELKAKRRGVVFVSADTAADMFKAVKENYSRADIIVMAAAVADYRPEKTFKGKIKRKNRENLRIKLVANPDILRWLGNRKEGRLLVGFSLDSLPDLKNEAKRKLAVKKADILLGFALDEKGGVAGTDSAGCYVFGPRGMKKIPRQRKDKLAEKILNELPCPG